MPIPISDALAVNEDIAVSKAAHARHRLGSYLVSSMLAGAYVGVAVVLLISVSSAFVSAQSPAAKLVQGAVFGIALTLVVFAGAELFTGNVMWMLQGLVAGKVRAGALAVVWAGSLVGNLVGSVALAAAVNAGGTFGSVGGKQSVFDKVLAALVKTRVGLTGGQLFWRSVLCNMLVCLALWMAGRTKSDAAKLLVLWWGLLAFVACGFEHSVANMTLFSLAVFAHHAGWGDLVRNLAWTVPGNVVGGGLLVAGAYSYIGRAGTAPPVPVPAERLVLDPATNGTVELVG